LTGGVGVGVGAFSLGILSKRKEWPSGRRRQVGVVIRVGVNQRATHTGAGALEAGTSSQVHSIPVHKL
jgi:hypothetical protein